jgi:hypothetical protein
VFPAPADLRAIDDVVQEYLIYRGFTRTFRALVSDCKNDKIQAYEVGAALARRHAK